MQFNCFLDCLNRSDFDDELLDEINRYSTDNISSDGFEHELETEHQEAPLEHPCLALKKILSSGTFYYSVNFDLTNRLQDRYGLIPPLNVFGKLKGSQSIRRIGV